MTFASGLQGNFPLVLGLFAELSNLLLSVDLSKEVKQGGNSLKDLRRMSFQGQGHFKVNVISRSRSFQGQGHFKVKVISPDPTYKYLIYWFKCFPRLNETDTFHILGHI